MTNTKRAMLRNRDEQEARLADDWYRGCFTCPHGADACSGCIVCFAVGRERRRGAMKVTVRYQAGQYSGVRTVEAEDTDEAIAIVRGRIRREMTLPMYSDSYRVESVDEDGNFQETR